VIDAREARPHSSHPGEFRFSFSVSRLCSAPQMPASSTTRAPRLIAIAAMASNRVIGREGELPWHLPGDLKFFKRTTLGHVVLMGRKTFDSIVARLGKPLPQRMNIVLSRTMPPREGVHVIKDISELPSLITDASSPVFLIGGAQLYAALLPSCAEILLTLITQPHEGDAHFPFFEDDFELKEILERGDGYEIRRYVRRVGSEGAQACAARPPGA
jgi:dihydrofolate reductase